MYRVSVAILHCAEYNLKKLKRHWRDPKSPEEALCWNLEFGITICVYHLVSSEIYHWNKPEAAHCHYFCRTREEKKAPVKLRKKLVGLLKSSNAAETENERIAILRSGIRNATKYLLKIKENESYLNSIALQDVYEHLSSLLEMKMSPSQPGGLPISQ